MDAELTWIFVKIFEWCAFYYEGDTEIDTCWRHERERERDIHVIFNCSHIK